jgi:hypothetical protein
MSSSPRRVLVSRRRSSRHAVTGAPENRSRRSRSAWRCCSRTASLGRGREHLAMVGSVGIGAAPGAGGHRRCPCARRARSWGGAAPAPGRAQWAGRPLELGHQRAASGVRRNRRSVAIRPRAWSAASLSSNSGGGAITAAVLLRWWGNAIGGLIGVRGSGSRLTAGLAFVVVIRSGPVLALRPGSLPARRVGRWP